MISIADGKRYTGLFIYFLSSVKSVTSLTLIPSGLGTKNAGQQHSVVSSTLLIIPSLMNPLRQSFAYFSYLFGILLAAVTFLGIAFGNNLMDIGSPVVMGSLGRVSEMTSV